MLSTNKTVSGSSSIFRSQLITGTSNPDYIYLFVTVMDVDRSHFHGDLDQYAQSLLSTKRTGNIKLISLNHAVLDNRPQFL
jgi:hypothetical protein